jgi:LuxR family transcriptional regulator, quorum-sensing system regulator CciR
VQCPFGVGGTLFSSEELTRRMKVMEESQEVLPLRVATMHTLELLGLHKAYFVAPLTSDPRIGRIVTNWGFDWTWEKSYRERLYQHDVFPDVAVEKLAPIVWPQVLAGRPMTQRQKRYIEFANEFGFERGIGVACFGPNGRSAFLGCALEEDAPMPDDKTLRTFNAIGQLAFHLYCRMIISESEFQPLSNREIEVLHWMGRGKSNSVIADIIGISQSSVDVYVRRIFNKFDVTDRTTACVKAVAQGLLVTADYEKFVDKERRKQYEKISDQN